VTAFDWLGGFGRDFLLQWTAGSFHKSAAGNQSEKRDSKAGGTGRPLRVPNGDYDPVFDSGLRVL
jgi:hypothetical protein